MTTKATRILAGSVAAVALLAVAAEESSLAAQTKNGFDLRDALIPAWEIRSGGPPRDGIPSIDNPHFITAAEAVWLNPEERVLGVEYNGLSKAYPLRIFDWHEIVNDVFADDALLITWCPLCGTGMVFERDIEGQRRSFGVSGLLYNSDVLLYDRATESLWSQIEMQAVSGPMRGTDLTLLTSSNTTWEAWRSEYPDTLVLSPNTGYQRDYSRSPYQGYDRSKKLYAPVNHRDDRFHAKTLVVGIEIGEEVKAWPLPEVERALDGESGSFSDTLGSMQVTVHYDAEAETAKILNAAGQELPTVQAYWFAWMAFHPETEVWEESLFVDRRP